MDPGDIPAKLDGLTHLEDVLIARAAPIMRV